MYLNYDSRQWRNQCRGTYSPLRGKRERERGNKNKSPPPNKINAFQCLCRCDFYIWIYKVGNMYKKKEGVPFQKFISEVVNEDYSMIILL